MTEQARKRIYLAGKIGEGDWRHGIVKGLRDAVGMGAHLSPWPILENAIFGKYDYIGPFFVSCDHGCFHGDGCHGQGIDGRGSCDASVETLRRTAVTSRCLQAIKDCDLFFAWLDTKDCYGTIVEIGIAHGLGKAIAVGFPYLFDMEHDLWFLHFLPGVLNCAGETVGECFADAINFYGWDCESLAELRFWEHWRPSDNGIGLKHQYKVFSGRYRLDFAHPATKTAIEIDGITYHGDDKHFTSDRQRDRELIADGWAILRFTAAEVREDIQRCVQETWNVIQARWGLTNTH